VFSVVGFSLQDLNFPRTYDFDLRTNAGQSEIFDTIRRKWLVLTPEEWVRQHMVRHLVEDLGYPAGRTGIETGFEWKGVSYRADIIVHERSGEAFIVAECKAPDVRINQRAFNQIGQYNQAIEARYLVVTNGLQHFCVEVSEDGISTTGAIPENPDKT
jgi:predicted type IV restriction endonuclease